MVIKRLTRALAPIVGLVAGLAFAAFNISTAHAESIDMSFNPGAYSPDGGSSVGAIVAQPDGKILVGGKFTIMDGQPRQNIGRLNADGRLDASFDPGADRQVYAIALQPDGKIVVGGLFTTLAGHPCYFLGRLNADGTLDACFNPGIVVGSGVRTVVVQPDGKILAAGWFDSLAGQPHPHLGRLNPDGSLDTTIDASSGILVAIALQQDGKTIIGGYNSQRVAYRLNEDGSRSKDTEFEAPLARTSEPYPDAISVLSLALQPDGKILVGGNFTTLDGRLWNGIARLYPNGSLDISFNPLANGMVTAISVQADGKILVGGNFTSLGGQPRYHIGRLNADGSLDTSFLYDIGGSSSSDARVWSLALQPDGGILVGGSFTTLGGQARENIGRIAGGILNDSQREALVTLYTQTGGSQWLDELTNTPPANWLSETVPVCGWQGVTCNGNGQVAQLSLMHVGMRGSLPPEIADLTQLQALYLTGNQVTSLPDAVGDLTQLKMLYLDSNPVSSLSAYACARLKGRGTAISPSSLCANYGDVNTDGAVTIVDAMQVAQYAGGLNPANFNVAVADVNEDGSVTIVDGMIIARYVSGLVPDLPYNPQTGQ